MLHKYTPSTKLLVLIVAVPEFAILRVPFKLYKAPSVLILPIICSFVIGVVVPIPTFPFASTVMAPAAPDVVKLTALDVPAMPVVPIPTLPLLNPTYKPGGIFARLSLLRRCLLS